MLQEQEPVGLLVAAARRSLKQAVLRHSRPLRLTPPQFWFLNAARELPDASLGEIGRRQRMDAPTASRIAEGLARRGLLKVSTDAKDRRVARVVLTASGVKLAARIAPLAAALRKAGTQNMSERELSALRASLRKFAENLDSFAWSTT
jgi:MarR family transcriptional regulator, organic hydroperoxide resistance regulator